MDPKVHLSEQPDGVYIELTLDQAAQKAATKLVTTNLLGKAKIPGLAFENADGLPLTIDTDYFGKMRNSANPSVGPFENPGVDKLKIKVW